MDDLTDNLRLQKTIKNQNHYNELRSFCQVDQILPVIKSWTNFSISTVVSWATGNKQKLTLS